jgi:hypothetical protein
VLTETRNFWEAMNQAVRTPDDDSDSNDDVPECAIKDALHRGYQHDDHIFFGSSEAPPDLSALHPNPVHIFRLWQIYLEDVDPLFKVTHSITLQARVVEAAANVHSIPPALEALMFGIYCVAITSLSPDDCSTAFGSSKEELLNLYRFACQHALTRARFLQSRDRDCLTALFFYIVSVSRFLAIAVANKI